MFNNYLKIALRSLFNNRFYTVINVFGLALGISCCIILFQFITYHLSFDKYHNNSEKIYRVVHWLTFEDGVPMYDQGAPLALARDVKTSEPLIKSVGILLRMHDINVTIAQNSLQSKKMFAEHENIGIANNGFFDIFNYDWEQGDKSNALNNPHTVVISHNIAQKYFGSQDVIGRGITVDGKNTFTVTGVIKDHPSNTDIKQDIFLSLSSLNDIYPDVANILKEQWGAINSTNSVYLSLRNGGDPKTIERKIAQLNIRAQGAEMAKAYHFMLLPLNKMHFDGRFSGVIQRSLLFTLGGVGFLLIVIACVNFVNMAIAQSFKRSREIGTRKVLGGTPMSIFNQFITETACIVIFSALFAFIIVLIALPVLNSWLQIQLHVDLLSDYRLLCFIVLTLTSIVFLAGAYPAVLLSRFKPVNALKNQIGGQTHTAALARKGLIVTQNVIAQVLIISTIIITMQVRYLKTADLGFNKSSVLMLPIPDAIKGKTEYLRNRLMADPAVKGVSFCYRAPSSTGYKGGSIKFDTHDWEKFAGRTLIGDANYVKTFGIKLVAGRNIAESDTVREFLINEVLMHKLGIKDPQQVIGKRFTSGDLSDKAGIITGVVKDFHDASLYTAISPYYITTMRKEYQFVGVKFSTPNVKAMIERVKQTWQSAYPDNVFEYKFLDQQVDDYYQKEELLNKLITSSAIIAILISCLGLLGLISLLTTQRTKEIGIRKVLGASVTQITGLLSADFIKLVLVAVIIASPLAWVIVSRYLQSFAYRIDINWWVFVLTAVLAITVAFITVSFQAIKAAIANPVQSLRNE